eukprot:6937673-Pyramimonas_sp.AAC.1
MLYALASYGHSAPSSMPSPPSTPATGPGAYPHRQLLQFDGACRGKGGIGCGAVVYDPDGVELHALPYCM